MKYTTYLFDFDGTLVDSMPPFISVVLRILDENHISYNDDIVSIITPLGYKGTAKYFRELGMDMEEEKIVSMMYAYALEEYEYRIPAKKNVIDVLKKLKEGGADLNILTDSPHMILDVCLERLGMCELFTNIWSCEEFNTTKRDPDIYVRAAEKIGKPISQILFLDDNYNVIKTAKLSGIKVCGVYDLSSKGYINGIKNASDYYINDFSELLLLG